MGIGELFEFETTGKIKTERNYLISNEDINTMLMITYSIAYEDSHTDTINGYYKGNGDYKKHFQLSLMKIGSIRDILKKTIEGGG